MTTIEHIAAATADLQGDVVDHRDRLSRLEADVADLRNNLAAVRRRNRLLRRRRRLEMELLAAELRLTRVDLGMIVETISCLLDQRTK